MTEEAIDVRDRAVIAERAFDKAQREHLKRLMRPDLIDEHRHKPMGQHSDDLERVLNYFRRGPTADKYAIFAQKPFAEYRMVSLSGQPGVPPQIVDDRTFPNIDDALHAVFLRRVDDLMSE